MGPEEIIAKMESLTADIDHLKSEMDKAEDGAKPAIKSLIDGKAAKFKELDSKLEDAERSERLEKAKASRSELDKSKTKVPDVDVKDTDHNKKNHERDHGKALLAYTTDSDSGDHAKSVLARDRGENFVNEISTKEGMKIPAAMADFIAPQQTSVCELEDVMGKSVEEAFGAKAVVLVRDASGSGSGGGSSVNVDFEPTLFKTPKRNNDIPGKCWVKRAVGKQAQYPKLTQSTNQYGVVATWGSGGSANGEGTAVTQSDPVQSRVDVNLERLGLLTSISKRYLRNNDINFLSELAWMFRGTASYKLGSAVLEGVAGLGNAPIGINTNASIGNGVALVARETASQVSYTDLVNMQFAVDDGVFGTGEYIISATNTGAMKYIAALDDTNGRPIFGGDSQSGWGVGGPGVIAAANYTNAKENTTALGGRGDVIYGNFMGYGLAIDGDDMAIERSDDYGFNTGQIYFRLIMYAGGIPLGYDMFSVLSDVSGVSSSSST